MAAGFAFVGWGRAAADVARGIAGRGGGSPARSPPGRRWRAWRVAAGRLSRSRIATGSSARALEVSEACRKQGAAVCVVRECAAFSLIVRGFQTLPPSRGGRTVAARAARGPGSGALAGASARGGRRARADPRLGVCERAGGGVLPERGAPSFVGTGSGVWGLVLPVWGCSGARLGEWRACPKRKSRRSRARGPTG